MPRASNSAVEIEYESFGEARAPAILLINGLGSQMTRWPEAFCARLTARGYRAIRFDNRDTGKSTWFGEGDRYTLSDMAADAMAVLDAVNVAQAHVAGVSMGGMISQLVAIEHPHRVRSLTSIMSASGAPGSLDPKPEAGATLTTAPPDPKADYEAFLAHMVRSARSELKGCSGGPTSGTPRRSAARTMSRARYSRLTGSSAGPISPRRSRTAA